MNAIASLLALFVLAGVPMAKMPDLATQIDRGRDALRRGEPQEAERLLQEAVRAARATGDDVSEARGLFFLGLLQQQQAEQQKDPDAARALFEGARDAYVQSLARWPASSSTAGNLAEVYEALGDPAAAIRTLEQGLTIDESRRGWFAVRLGDLHAAQGNHDMAVTAYRTAAQADPAIPAIEKKIIDAHLASSRPPAELISYLWGILPTASADDVLRGTIRLLQKGGLDPSAVDAAFGLLAATLAKHNYTQIQLAELRLLQDFVALRAVDAYRERAEAMTALLHGDFAKEDALRAWPAATGAPGLPSDLSPRRALADLSAALGRRAAADKRVEEAERYFVLARDLGNAGDLQLASDLASVYFSQRRLADLQKITRELDAILYAPDGAASSTDAAQLYEFHRTIGTYHALLEPALTGGTTKSAATDQLQKALEAARRVSDARVREGKAPFEADPTVQKLLTVSTRKASKRD